MTQIKIFKCDRCGRTIEDGEDFYGVVIHTKTPRGIDGTLPIKGEDFCRECIKAIRTTMEESE